MSLMYAHRMAQMNETQQDGNEKSEIIEDFEALLELRVAYESHDRKAFEGVLDEICNELADEYRAQLKDKVCRWATSTVVLRFYDRPPARAYIQAKILYRDGFYEATILVARSIAEMVCYDRLDGMRHPFGTRQQVERKNFRELVKWLKNNDSMITEKVFEKLNDLYDLGNNYVHPKAGHNAKEDSLKALHLIGESVFDIYGVKDIDDMVGRCVRSPYSDFPDICTGKKFMLTSFTSPEAAMKHIQRHR